MSNRAEKERRRQQRLANEHEQAIRAERRKQVRWYGASALAVVIGVAVVVIGLSHRGSGAGSTLLQPVDAAAPALAATPTKGVPKPIRANLKQGNRVIDDQISSRLRALKGVPVVVNMWASWCPNCKAEFGFFQDLSRKYVKRVAFVGLDSQDARGDADRFLQQHPVNYPSIYDQSAAQAQSIGAGYGWPTTVYYDRAGRRTYVRQGGYTSEASLEADLRRYALGS